MSDSFLDHIGEPPLHYDRLGVPITLREWIALVAAAGTSPAPSTHHLLADSADRHTICGLKITEPKAMPYLLARWLPAHQAGRGPLDVCPECERRPPLSCRTGRAKRKPNPA